MNRPDHAQHFMMGEFQTTFPADRLYAKNHMWAVNYGTRLRFGLTEYAVRLLQDVYFLDWNVPSPVLVNERQEIGVIESKKAESDLFAPLAGKLVAFNPEALDDPSVINVSPYQDGWLFELEPVVGGDLSLLSTDAYLDHLETAWEVAQRTIKGQVNRD